ncbi:MAG: hypothetical protein HY908_13850 [Myxococcales bacterium]|nr:hypothetical protein [Myxococcales bacterium]
MAKEESDGYFALATTGPGGDARVVVGNFETQQVCIVIQLMAAGEAFARLAPPLVLVGDRAGRMLAFDLATGRVVHDLRLG